MTQAIPDIYTKIADIYDKICDQSSDIKTEVEYINPYDDNTYEAPFVFLANPDSEEEITQAQGDINSAIGLAFSLVASIDQDYFSTLAGGDIVPSPKDSPLVWLPKLIELLIGYSAPVSFITSIIIDFLKEIILEQIRNRIKRKTQVVFGSFNITNESVFVIPHNAEELLIEIGTIPNWIGKRFDGLDNSSTERHAVLGSISLGFIPESTDDYYWTIDEPIRFKRQWIDLKRLKDIKYRRGLIKFDYSLSASIHFIKFI